MTKLRYVTTGKEPGLSFDTAMAAAFFLEHKKITRAEYYWTFADALEAAGLSE